MTFTSANKNIGFDMTFALALRSCRLFGNQGYRRLKENTRLSTGLLTFEK